MTTPTNIPTHNKIKTQDFLARLPLFNQIMPPELDRIAAHTTEIHLARGKTLFQQGDPCLGFHSVVVGQVKLALKSPLGSEKIVEVIGPGHSFGEAVMFMDKPYIVSAEALSDSFLLHVNKAAVFSEIERDPAFARKMLGSLSRRLHSLMSDVEAYSLRSGTQRVIGYLLKDETDSDDHANNANDSGGTSRACEITLQVSKTVIASRLNLTPEHLSRILHELCQASLISVSGKHITILDIDRLRRHAC